MIDINNNINDNNSKILNTSYNRTENLYKRTRLEKTNINLNNNLSHSISNNSSTNGKFKYKYLYINIY